MIEDEEIPLTKIISCSKCGKDVEVHLATKSVICCRLVLTNKSSVESQKAQILSLTRELELYREMVGRAQVLVFGKPDKEYEIERYVGESSKGQITFNGKFIAGFDNVLDAYRELIRPEGENKNGK